MANYVRFQRKNGSVGAGLLEGGNIAVINEPFWASTTKTGETVGAGDVRLLPPTEPRSIICVGLNYSSHLNGRAAPNPPTLFYKPLSSIAGPDDDVVLPKDAGRRNGNRSRRGGHPQEYSGLADRGQQRYREYVFVSRARGYFGPNIATGLQYDSIELKTRVNGVDAQHGVSNELILDIPDTVRWVAAVQSLVPGDIIYTGTPGSPAALKPGDVMEIEVAGVGILRNTVV